MWWIAMVEGVFDGCVCVVLCFKTLVTTAHTSSYGLSMANFSPKSLKSGVRCSTKAQHSDEFCSWNLLQSPKGDCYTKQVPGMPGARRSPQFGKNFQILQAPCHRREKACQTSIYCSVNLRCMVAGWKEPPTCWSVCAWADEISSIDCKTCTCDCDQQSTTSLWLWQYSPDLNHLKNAKIAQSQILHQQLWPRLNWQLIAIPSEAFLSWLFSQAPGSFQFN